MKVITNATPLIALAAINRLDLLRRLFAEVLVPAAVYDEVVGRGAGYAGAEHVAQAAWLQIRVAPGPVTIDPLLLGLDAGELAVLLLAREERPDWVLIDERLGRRMAQALHLPVMGTLGVLLAAFRVGWLSQAEAQQAVQDLVSNGIRLSKPLLDWFEAELNVNLPEH
jgi:predicted nucleic acid-binding protein